jgi:O-antigen ligase
MARSLLRVIIAMFTALVFLLIQSVFWSPTIPNAIAAAVVVLIVIAYFRPHNALLVLAALAPLGSVWSPLANDRMRGAEALVLAFLAGVLLRGWTLHRFRSIPTDRLRIAAIVFGLIVSLSCMRLLWSSGSDSRDLLDYLTIHYVTSFRSYGEVFGAMLLIEGLALLLYAAHYCRAQPAFAWRLARMLVIGGVAAASVNFWFFVHELVETGQPAAHFTRFFLHTRWSAHVGDVNAAGSFFLMIMFISLGLSLPQKRYWLGWLVVGLLTSLALWMTASRTALIAAVVVGFICLGKLAITRSRSGPRWSIAFGAASVAVILGSQYFLFRPVSASVPLAMDIRWEFLKTTWRMIEAHPLLGVGIGQYPQLSGRYSSPALIAFYPRENAHNNFAQVAGELGLIGFAAFLGVLAICFWFPDRSRRHDPVVAAVIAGLAAFIVSWLGGHPLLVPEVAYQFWLALAIVASAHPT